MIRLTTLLALVTPPRSPRDMGKAADLDPGAHRQQHVVDDHSRPLIKNDSLAEVKFEPKEIGNPEYGCALAPP